MRKVLVLEDEPNIRSFVVINLKRAGYETIEAGDGEEALELTLPWAGAVATDAMTGQQFLAVEGRVHLTLPPMGGVLLV